MPFIEQGRHSAGGTHNSVTTTSRFAASPATRPPSAYRSTSARRGADQGMASASITAGPTRTCRAASPATRTGRAGSAITPRHTARTSAPSMATALSIAIPTAAVQPGGQPWTNLIQMFQSPLGTHHVVAEPDDLQTIADGTSNTFMIGEKYVRPDMRPGQERGPQHLQRSVRPRLPPGRRSTHGCCLPAAGALRSCRIWPTRGSARRPSARRFSGSGAGTAASACSSSATAACGW